MGVYIGGTRVAPILNTVIEKTKIVTQDSQGNTISETWEEPVINTNYVVEDPDNLSSDLPIVSEWTRPNGWPNLDALPALTEGIYLTYDNTSRVDWKWASFRFVMNTGNCRVALGHVNNNTWIQDEYWDVASNTYKEINYGTSTYSSYNYVVFKITPASTNHIYQFYFAQIAQATLGTYALRQQYDQYCLERIGKLPYLITANGSGDAYRYCCEWMEHDNVEFGDTLTSLSAAWYRGRRLKKIEWGNWTGENCNITSLSSAFEQCYQIEKLDLSQWHTTNWHVTSIQNMFVNCRQLRILNVPFNTVNWGNTSNRTITFQGAFDTCLCLETLDLSTWDTSNLVVTTLYCTWNGCYHLKSLNVKNWDTSKWTCNSLYYTWGNCRQLIDIDLSNWNTSNWTVGRMDGCWINNYKRRDFKDIENWKTYKWKIVQFNSAFSGCMRVQEINLENWEVGPSTVNGTSYTGWKVSTLGSTWQYCYALRHLHVSSWNTIDWAVTTIASMLSWCNCLEEWEMENWNTSNWPLVGMGSCFQECWSLKTIDFTKLNTTNWSIAPANTFAYVFQNCYSLKSINVSNLDISNVTLANYGSNGTSYTSFSGDYNLEHLVLPSSYKGYLYLSTSYLLTRQELVRIFNELPTALSGAKITLGTMRYKLTNDDIAIATGKGYTVA